MKKIVIDGVRMSSGRLWTLTFKDGSKETFKDVRRKVGNQIIRIYLLDDVLTEKRIEKKDASLRGPKKEFKDFTKYFILCIKNENEEICFLTETGVYENMRIVGTNSDKITQLDSDEIVKIYTDALTSPEKYHTSFIMSNDSDIKSKR